MITRETHRPADAVARLLAGVELDAEDVGPAREGAEVLFDALWREPGLKTEGVESALLYLRGRLIAYDAILADRRRYPEIAREKIVAPIVIAGPPRSGTTFFHSLLSQDPAFRSPLAWEMAEPSPPPEAATYETDPRIARWSQVRLAPGAKAPDTAADKEFAAKHLMGATIPEECGGMFTASLRNTDIYSRSRVQPYCNWAFYADQRPKFAVHRKWLQHFQWRNPRERWLLKYPSYGYTPDALFEAYPDVTLVQTHRDPRQTISSLCSLIGTLRKASFETQDPHALGLEMLHHQQLCMGRPLAYRKANPGARIIDVSYLEVMADPIGAVERLYRRMGLHFSDVARERMTKFIADTPQGKHGEHRHSLDQYGLSENLLRERLADYYEAYGALFQ